MVGDVTNRDIVFLLALAAVAAVALSRAGARATIASLLGAFRPFALVVLGFAVYFGALIAAAQQVGLWNSSLVKDAVAWFLLAGLLLLFRFTKTYEDRRFYGRTLRGLIGVSVAVEFFVSLSSFSFAAELLLLLAIVLLALFSAVAGVKPKTRKVKSIADGLLAILGLIVIGGTAVTLVSTWATLDKGKLALSFLLPLWATIGCLPFVSLFGLYANYQSKFGQINWAAPKDRRARRRSKAALLLTFRMRNRALGAFTGADARELTSAKSWGEARRVLAYQRAVVRAQETDEDLAAERLRRFQGVEGTDWEGKQLDQREFEPTKLALDRLAMFHRARHENGRYRADLMEVVGGLLSDDLPEDAGITMTVHKKGRSWFAWRRTVTGWCLGVGAAGPPPDQWSYEGPEPPLGFPRAGTAWTPGAFDGDTET
jgi:hypothetical protein